MISACTLFGDRSGTEEPPYTVVDTLAESIEVRRYGPRLAAEVVVTGDEEETRSAGFRKLAAFIFGDNRGEKSIAMTAPVGQSSATDPVSQSNAEKIAMTAPVSQSEASDGEWRVRFFMPRDYTEETLPEPTDPEIAIVTVPAETLAVVRFSGSRSAKAVDDADGGAARRREGQRLAGGRQTGGAVLRSAVDALVPSPQRGRRRGRAAQPGLISTITYRGSLRCLA